jgi:hypothetical protein
MARRRYSLLVPVAIALAALLQCAAAGAELRCGARLVSRGDPAHRVASICGEPDAVVQRVEYRTVRRGVGAAWVGTANGQPCAAREERTREIVIEEWTYDFGANRLVQRLTFEDGVLTRIDSAR